MAATDAIVEPPPQVTPSEAAAELLARRKARKRLYDFLVYNWKVIEPGYQFVSGWYIEAICEHLEAVAAGEIQWLLINLPPRMLKSILTGVAYPAYTWLHEPTHKFMFASYSYKLAEDTSLKCRLLIEHDRYQKLYRGVHKGEPLLLREDRNTKEYYANSQGGERIITSVDGTTTGRGADTIVLDDPNSARDQSDTVLESTIQFITQVVPTRFNDQKRGRMIVVQQRVHEKDATGYYLANMPGQFVHLRLPMEFEANHRCVTVKLPNTRRKWQDPRQKEGDLLAPERVGAPELRRLKSLLGSQYAISGQLQQRPAPAEGGIIKRAWFQIWKEPDPPKCDYIVMSVDTALSEKKSAAFSAVTTWGVFHIDGERKSTWDAQVGGELPDAPVPNLILLSAWRGQVEYPVLRERIWRMSQDYLDDEDVPLKQKSTNRAPHLILVEAKANGLSLIQDLRRAGVMATKFSPDKLGDKLMRVRLVTPLLEGGRVWVPGRPPTYKQPRLFAEQFVEQATVFPAGASRDYVDTMTQALWRLMSSGFVWHPKDVGPGEPPDREIKPAFY
jgi:predicted phage terminase large subunit-like protein